MYDSLYNTLPSSLSERLDKSYAHSPGKPEKGARGGYHRLSEHIRGVVEKASRFGSKIGMEVEASLLAFFHDLGKVRPGFQDMLFGEAPKEKSLSYHSAFGALCLNAASEEARSGGLNVLATLSLGHHGGPKDCIDGALPRFYRLRSLAGELSSSEVADASAAGRCVAALAPKVSPLITNHLHALMAFSCLVDADWLDTEEHFEPSTSLSRKGQEPAEALFLELRQRLEERCSSFPKEGEVNAIRSAVREQAAAASKHPRGMFTFTGPTGVGKSLSAMTFAINHALQCGHERIVYAAPFISVVDQNAAVFEEVLGLEHVLTHHSNLVYKRSSPGVEQHRLGTQNWEYPVVCTTGVAFVETLFSNLPTRARRLHNLANSVILIDEAQFLPIDKMSVIARQLDSLVNHFGCSIVLMTATQPNVLLNKDPRVPEAERVWPRGCVEIVDNVGEVFQKLKRVEVVDARKTLSNQDLLVESIASGQSSALVVLNKKPTAASVTRKLVSLVGPEPVLHLSTSMCPAHRRDTIQEVVRRLGASERCILVSTQVVEAGVDISFPVGYRDLGPLDSIIQVKGRINRSGEFRTGILNIADLGEGEVRGLGEAYARGRSLASAVLSSRADIDDPRTVSEYFKNMTREMNTNKLQTSKSGRNINLLESLLRLRFETVGKHFHMIDDTDQTSVVVDYKGGARKLVGSSSAVPGAVVRLLQPFTVSLYTNKFERLLATGAVESVGIDRPGQQPGAIYVLRPEFYSNLYGVVQEES